MGRGRKFNDKEKWCNRCRCWLSLDSFGFSSRTVSGRQDYCQLCHNKRTELHGTGQRGPGFVYVIGNAALQKFKVGVSADPKRRLGNIRINSPMPVELVKTVAVANMLNAEWDIHQRLASKHSHGEWFNLTLEEALEIQP